MNPEFISALKDIEKERAIPLEIILEAIEDALTAAYKKNYSASQDVAVKIDRVTGAINAIVKKLVVEKVTHPQTEIALREARTKDKTIELGSEMNVVVVPDDFGRIAAQTAKQVIVQRIREAERDIVFGEFTKREESLVTGIVQRYEQKSYTVDLGRVEGVLPPSEQVPSEHFRHGDRLKAVIIRAQKTPKGPQIILSRTAPSLVTRLFESEVPEIASGVIKIKSVVREPGDRSKIAVESSDKKIEPVGACVGPKGSRVQGIVDELKNEKIDIINWDSDPSVYISNSLRPARVVFVNLYAFDKSALVIVPDNQLSLAIGKEGQNVRLAARLTGWKIDIKSETQYEQSREEIESHAKELERLHNEELARLKKEKEEEQLLLKKKQEQEEAEAVAITESVPELVEQPPETASEDVPEEISEYTPAQAEYEENEDLREILSTEPSDFLEPQPMPVPGTVSSTEDAERAGGRKKKRKDRRADEEREEMAAKKQHKKPKRSRAQGEYEQEDDYEEYNWKS